MKIKTWKKFNENNGVISKDVKEEASFSEIMNKAPSRIIKYDTKYSSGDRHLSDWINECFNDVTKTPALGISDNEIKQMKNHQNIIKSQWDKMIVAKDKLNKKGVVLGFSDGSFIFLTNENDNFILNYFDIQTKSGLRPNMYRLKITEENAIEFTQHFFFM